MYACMYAYMHVCMFVYSQLMCVCMHACMYVCVFRDHLTFVACMYACMHVCMYVCYVCIFRAHQVFNTCMHACKLIALTVFPLLRSESGVAACSPSFHSPRLFFYFWAQYGRIQDFFFQNLVKWTQNVGEESLTTEDHVCQ